MAQRDQGITIRVHTAARCAVAGPQIGPGGSLAALEALPETHYDRSGLRAWTPSEVDALRRYYGRRRVGDIARALGRSYGSVLSRLHGMRIAGQLVPPS